MGKYERGSLIGLSPLLGMNYLPRVRSSMLISGWPGAPFWVSSWGGSVSVIVTNQSTISGGLVPYTFKVGITVEWGPSRYLLTVIGDSLPLGAGASATLTWNFSWSYPTESYAFRGRAYLYTGDGQRLLAGPVTAFAGVIALGGQGYYDHPY